MVLLLRFQSRSSVTKYRRGRISRFFQVLNKLGSGCYSAPRTGLSKRGSLFRGRSVIAVSEPDATYASLPEPTTGQMEVHHYLSSNAADAR